MAQSMIHGRSMAAASSASKQDGSDNFKRQYKGRSDVMAQMDSLQQLKISKHTGEGSDREKYVATTLTPSHKNDRSNGDNYTHFMVTI
jgi:hypothetical protein